ncbi:MAG: putative lipid II flippase FtsW [Burkholderiales bacterium]|nr:putative lipid II flippase FtsW [Burkholderiales bacterium]
MFYNAIRRRPSMLGYDQSLVWTVLLLLAVGLVMVYSASIASAEVDKQIGFRSSYFLVRHCIFLGIGMSCALLAFQVPIRVWQQYAPYLFLLGAALLVLVLVPHIGKVVNGSRRWLNLFVVNFQPSEAMKFFAVLYAADYTVRKAAYMHSLVKGFFPMFLVMLFTGGLLLAEPDFGAFAVITAIAMGLLFLGGFDWRLFGGLIVMLVIGFVGIIVSSPYRMQRVIGFMDPFKDPYGKGYQLSHALIAFGRGKWFGVGLGGSVEKLSYLPEAHTDFLMAIIAEEFGFVGVALVVLLFAWLIYRAFAIGRQAAKLERYYAALVAQGIGIWLGVQSIINMGVNMGVLPTKGLTLPLLSFGGSGILANLVALAVLLRVDWENRQLMRGYTV